MQHVGCPHCLQQTVFSYQHVGGRVFCGESTTTGASDEQEQSFKNFPKLHAFAAFVLQIRFQAPHLSRFTIRPRRARTR